MCAKKTEWEWKKLGEVCEVQGGATPLKTNNAFWEGGSNPWLTIDDIRCQGRVINYTKQHVTDLALTKVRVFPEKSVLLCCTASVGEFAITNIALSSNQQFNALIVKDELRLSPEFLFHFCGTLKQTLLALSGKTTIDFISSTKIKNLQIPVPPLSEQKRIVKVLDETFAKIDSLKTAAETNLKNAKELFQTTLAKELSITDEKIKQGWSEVVLDSCCEIKSALVDPKESEYQSLMHVGGANIESETGRLFDLKTAKEEKLISGKFLFDETMILYSKIRPYLKKIVRPNFTGLCCADIYPISVKKNMDKGYLYYMLYSESFTDYANKNSARAGMPKINREALFAYEFFLPPLSIQKQIVEKLDSLSQKVSVLESNYKKVLADCDELKKSILKKAFNGEL